MSAATIWALDSAIHAPWNLYLGVSAVPAPGRRAARLVVLCHLHNRLSVPSACWSSEAQGWSRSRSVLRRVGAPFGPWPMETSRQATESWSTSTRFSSTRPTRKPIN